MADEDMEPAEGAAPVEATAKPPRKSLLKRLLVPSLGCIVSAGLAVAFSAFVLPPAGAPGDGDDEVPAEVDIDSFAPARTVDLGSFQLTLADKDKEGFARIALALEFRAREPVVTEKRLLEDLKVVIQDKLLMHMSGKISSDLKGTEGKNLLKLELMDMLSPIIFPTRDEGVLINLYYKDFLVQ